MWKIYVGLVLSIYFIVNTQSISTVEYDCYTPTNEYGMCVPVYLCPSISSSLLSLERPEVKKLKQLLCPGFTLKQLVVCCGTSELLTMKDTIAHMDFDLEEESTSIPYIGYPAKPTTSTGTTTRTTTGYPTTPIPPTRTTTRTTTGYPTTQTTTPAPSRYTATRRITRYPPTATKAYIRRPTYPTAQTTTPIADYTTQNNYQHTTRNTDKEVNTIPLNPIRGHELKKQMNMADLVQKNYDNRYLAVKNILPKSTECGITVSEYNKYQEYPWLVHLYYSNTSQWAHIQYLSTGILINKKYILRNVHTNDLPINIHIAINKTDYMRNGAIPDKSSLTEVQEIAYKSHDNSRFDFILLRLSEEVSIRDYRIPICLPLKMANKKPFTDDALVFSAWNNEYGNRQNNLGNIFAQILKCSSFEQLDGCMAPDSKTFGTLNEQGGVLMYKHQHQWYLNGIISTTFILRDSNVGPVVFDISQDVLQWIFDHIRD